MRFAIAFILSLTLLTSCATMESAWDTTAHYAKKPVDWVLGGGGDEDISTKGAGRE